MKITKAKISLVCDALGITPQLSKELLLLAGGDSDLVIKCSKESNGLDHCKANIMNQRITKIENGVSHESQRTND